MERKFEDKWEVLADKYFEGLCSDREEQELKRWLASSDDPRFDGIKAVMGFISAEKASRRHSSVRLALRPLVACAAALALIIGIGFSLGSGVCVTYAEGRTISDKEVVMQDVHNTLAELLASGNATDVEEVLGDIFD